MKRNKYFSCAGVLVMALITGFRIADDPSFLKKLRESLTRYNKSLPEEKVYLQFDKPFYKPGEDIWFNAFVLNSNSHKATSISDVVYVELIDPKGNVASKLDLLVQEGTAHGDFALQHTAPGGIYQVRAYTQWMKNFGKETFFTKEIQVQRIVTPRLLLKMDYQKESYGPAEEVHAKLMIRNLKNEAVGKATVTIKVAIDGSQIHGFNNESDENGNVNIRFSLPDSLKTTDGLLTVIVSSEGVQESISRSIPIVLNKINIQFMPEGGTWMTGVNSRVAFKALNEFGKGADVSGSIVDENQNVVTRFESFHMGMGAFDLIPATNQKYFARIDQPAGNSSLVPLPDPTATGFLMNLISSGDNSANWHVHSSRKTKAYLVAHTHGEIIYTKELLLNPGANRITHNTVDFPSGIAVFTLFDDNGDARCERLVFLNQSRGLTIKITPDKKQYLPREQVRLDIKTLDAKGQPVASKISLAVVDDQLITFADDKQDNILSSLLLSSELKGEIQEPAFYFDPDEPKANKALDFLLMTQGWRRFTWKDVLHSNKTISHSPEKNKNLSGMLLNSHGSATSGEVTLLELGGRKRIIPVQTTANGYFVFKNIDPTIPLLLLTRKPGEISLTKSPPPSGISLNDKDGTVMLADIHEDVSLAPGSLQREEGESPADANVDLSLAADVAQLSEIVVTAFGASEKRSIAGSVVVVRENDVDGVFGMSLEGSLQGRVSGIQIRTQSGNPSPQTNMSIRGLSSLGGGRNEPLYVIDGHPIGTSLNQNFSNGSLIGPDDIETIEVIDSPEATALFGGAATNGVIMITTRSRIGYYHFKSKKRKARYSSLSVTPRKFSQVRDFYVPPPVLKKQDGREDFRTTVFWNHTVVTDENGSAKVSFYNNDALSAFRITAEGFSSSGELGRTEQVYHTELPLSMDAKLPQYLGYEDVLRLPLQVRNATASAVSAHVTITLPAELQLEESSVKTINIPPKMTETVWFTIKPRGTEGEFPVSIRLESVGHTDQLTEIIRVKPVGFPANISFSAKQLDNTFDLSIRDAERNSLKAEVSAFPDVLTELFTGAEAILREPYGCFEQVSSSTFPNILALQFMRQSGMTNPDTEKRAEKFIADGYAKLTAYEIKGGGYEWFGHPPAHEGLTAYGLIQFHEMSKVFNGVDANVVDRTRDWLMSRRNGRGGFHQNAGKYGFSGASRSVTNAYVTYALSETGMQDLLPEYNASYSEALKSNDMYRMALVATTAYNMGKLDDYERLVNHFRDEVNATGLERLKAEHSIVRSYGNSLANEVIALWAVALMKSPRPDLKLVNTCIQRLLSNRAQGHFGSTQGTALALKALTEYAQLIRTTRDNGEIQVYIDGILADHLAYDKDVRDRLTLNKFTDRLDRDGNQTMRIRFEGTSEPLPYSVNIRWHTKSPQSNEACSVALNTALSSNSVALNETVRMTAVLKNKTREGLPMTVAVIGIPAGLTPQPWQLKELQDRGVFDFYEILGGNLVIYYREMAPGGEHRINLDLKAEIPGSYTGPASSAYLYYANEFKHWVEGTSVVIR